MASVQFSGVVVCRRTGKPVPREGTTGFATVVARAAAGGAPQLHAAAIVNGEWSKQVDCSRNWVKVMYDVEGYSTHEERVKLSSEDGKCELRAELDDKEPAKVLQPRKVRFQSVKSSEGLVTVGYDLGAGETMWLTSADALFAWVIDIDPETGRDVVACPDGVIRVGYLIEEGPGGLVKFVEKPLTRDSDSWPHC